MFVRDCASRGNYLAEQTDRGPQKIEVTEKTFSLSRKRPVTPWGIMPLSCAKERCGVGCRHGETVRKRQLRSR